MSHWGLINRLASRRFASDVIAEEAALFVINGLEDNNWQRLKHFSGNASLATYLSTLTFRLLEDFARKKFGRLRPPLWIRNLGGVWELLFRFLCQERLPVGEAVEHVRVRMPSEERAAIEDSARTIRAEVTDCGESSEYGGSARESMTIPIRKPSTQQHLEEAERNLFFAALFKGLLDTDREDVIYRIACPCLYHRSALGGGGEASVEDVFSGWYRCYGGGQDARNEPASGPWPSATPACPPAE